MIDQKSVAFIVCRLLALYFFYSLVQWLPRAYFMTSGTLFKVSASPGLAEELEYSVFTLDAIRLLTVLVPMIFFWFGADWLSSRICQKKEEDKSHGQWDQNMVLSLVIVATGLVMVLGNIAYLTQWIYVSLFERQGSYLSTNVFLDFPGPLVSLFFGCLFIAGAGTIARFVTRLRRW